MLLEGVRVVEHATYIAPPGAGSILAEWGADVIKIEPPGGDPIRRFFATIGAEIADNPVFELDNRGKRSIVVDTAQDAGRAVIRTLAAQADVFLTNVRPGGLQRAGLDGESLRAANPRLVYASVTGYGLEGPDADRAGFDIAAFWARSGMAALTAPKGTDPFPLRTGMGDHVCSVTTAAGILAALFQRERTGVGQIVDASLLRAATWAIGSDLAIQMAFGRVASNRPRRQAVQPLANFFRSRDGRWLTIVPRQTGDEWGALQRALDAETLGADARFASPRARRENGEAFVDALDAAFARLDFQDLTRRLDAENIVWAPVQTAAELVADPQWRAAGGVATVRRPDGSTFESPAGPIRFPGAEPGERQAAPALGADTRAVLAQAGYREDEIQRLIDAKAVHAA